MVQFEVLLLLLWLLVLLFVSCWWMPRYKLWIILSQSSGEKSSILKDVPIFETSKYVACQTFIALSSSIVYDGKGIIRLFENILRTRTKPTWCLSVRLNNMETSWAMTQRIGYKRTHICKYRYHKNNHGSEQNHLNLCYYHLLLTINK